MSRDALPRPVTALAITIAHEVETVLGAGLGTVVGAVLGAGLGLAVALACGFEARAAAPRYPSRGAHAQDRPSGPATTRLDVGGAVTELAVVDLDGDDRPEIVAAVADTAEGPAARRLVVLRTREDGADFTEADRHEIPAGADDVAFGIGELGGRSPRRSEIAMLGSGGIRLGRPAPGEPAIYDGRLLFPTGDARELPRWSRVIDLDGRGGAEILVPAPDAWLVLARQPEPGGSTKEPPAAVGEGAPEGGAEREEASERNDDRRGLRPPRFAAVSRVGLPAHRGVGAGPFDSLRLDFSTPSLHAAARDGDGRLDLWLLSGEELRVSRQDERGAFPAERRVIETVRHRSDDGERVESSWILLEDLDGASGAELIVSRQGGRLSLLGRTLTRVLVFGDGDELTSRKPRQALALRGVGMPPSLEDVDGDGALDLVTASIRVDAMSGIQTALLRTVRVAYTVFRGRPGEDRFDPQPALETTIGFSLEATRIGLAPLASFGGDFDGDGIRDLLTLDAADRFCVYRGRERTGLFGRGAGLSLPDRPDHVLDSKPDDGFAIEDLDGDGKSELLVYGRRGIEIIAPARSER